MTPKSVIPQDSDTVKKIYQPPKEILAEHKEFIKKVGEKLKQIRTAKTLTPSQLSSKSGVSRTLLYLIEGGKTYFTISTLLHVLDTMEISASDFFKEL